MVTINITEEEYKHMSNELGFKFERYVQEIHNSNDLLEIRRFNNISDGFTVVYIKHIKISSNDIWYLEDFTGLID